MRTHRGLAVGLLDTSALNASARVALDEFEKLADSGHCVKAATKMAEMAHLHGTALNGAMQAMEEEIEICFQVASMNLEPLRRALAK